MTMMSNSKYPAGMWSQLAEEHVSTWESILIIDGAVGKYVPQAFAKSNLTEGHVWRGVDKEDIAILMAGPEHVHYWDAWRMVEDNAYLVDRLEQVWRLVQFGDLYTFRFKNRGEVEVSCLEAVGRTRAWDYMVERGMENRFIDYLRECDFDLFTESFGDGEDEIDLTKLVRTFLSTNHE